ncbi:citrate/2-methylcitrate synthase [Burkholderia contaminans]|uniref:citrate/2-methylcitrate synthase n=1 Tax=Burkholderia contaminans TaxID=488447 RepID=UPI000F58DBD4|nr:citrate/2-methylcitrate synthase [Burkholderia contaminans]ELK6461968.1 citrate synthase family protein [Burkholderia contaminans]MCA7889430.1 citrate synthase family protein [Burkholderia contaminans]RQT35636.1 citrate synthase [Burkholderia contaminans]
MQNWITLTEAARRLGVRAQTVYAYASRGSIAVMQDPDDPRRSLYRAEDVVALCRKKQVGRKRAALAAGTIFGAEPCIYSGITTFSKGRAWYRGRDSIQLADTATLEETAALLWQATTPVSFDAPAIVLPTGERDRQCAFTTLATLAAHGHSTLGRLDSALHIEAGQLVAIVSRAFGAHDDAGAGTLCTHQRLAAGWTLDSRGADLLRRAMVLVADHEITSSAFAARITASTGASLAGCLLTGLATLSGPLHGDASGRVRAMFDDVQRLGAERVVDHHLRSAIPLPGFGHHLYPDGDPRAAALLARLDSPAEIAHFVDKVMALTGLRPTIDVALAMLSVQLRLPRDAAFGLLSIARSVGLLAHCIEQLRVGKVIRPRSRYTGPALDDRHLRPAADDDGKLPKAGVIDKNRVFKVVE